VNEFNILPENLYDRDIRIVKGVLLRYIQMGLSFIDYLVRRMEVEGIVLDYSYNISNSPRGYNLTLTFTIRDIDPRELHRIARKMLKVAKGVSWREKELKTIKEILEREHILRSEERESSKGVENE